MWDGRGDALEDARLTTVDGRMADDLRLKLPHFRVMAHVGRQNGRRGWLRISQTELAGRWGMGRTTVSRACNELVGWGYLMQRTQHEAGESFCQYKIRLDGEDSPSWAANESGADAEGCTTDCAPGSRAKQPSKRKSGAGSREGCTLECAPPHLDLGQGGVCATEHTPSNDPGRGGSVLPTAHMCAPTEYTGVLPTAHPPYIEHARTDYRRQTPNNTRPPTAVTLREAGEGEDRSENSSRPGLNTRGWKSDWDMAARNAVQDLLGTGLAHVATHLLVPVVGTLGPPKGVHGASYVRDLAEMVGRFPPEVLGVVAQALKLERKYDLPAACDVHALARAAAPMAGSKSAAAPRAGRTAPDTDAWLAALARGDGADPTIALSRQLVQRLGPEVTVAWFAGLEVQREGPRLRLLLPSQFLARYVAAKFLADILLAARACWPEVAEETITVAERRSADAA